MDGIQTKGIWIPIEIWTNKMLTWQERIVLGYIINFTNKDNLFEMSDRELAQHVLIHHKSISRTVNDLINKGYMWVIKQDGDKRVLKINSQYDRQ